MLISKEQYLQLNTRPKRTSKVAAALSALPHSPLRALPLWRDACNQEAMAFSAVLLAALATGSHCLQLFFALMRGLGGAYLYHNWDEEPVRTKVCAVCNCSAFCVSPHTHSQREVAVAHSGAAWAQLKDAFTLSSTTTPVEVEDSGSLGHKVKLGWNNGAIPQAASLPPNVTRVPWQVSGAFVMRCGGCLKIEPWRVNKTCLINWGG